MSRETFMKNMEVLGTPEGIQQYILGTKKNGHPRAVYDVIRDYTLPRKKKGKKKGKKRGMYSFYLGGDYPVAGKRKKKHKNGKHWHI